MKSPPKKANDYSKLSHKKPIFTDVPLFHILTRLFNVSTFLSPIWRAICAFRWMASRPFSIKVLPKFFPVCLSVPYLKRVPYICYGEILFLFPIAVIVILSIESAIWNMDVEDSGSICKLPLIIVYLTANKSNSLITFVLGIPYERMIFWHALWSITAVVTGALHLYCAYFLGEMDDRRLNVFHESYDERHLSDSGDGDGSSIYGLNGTSPSLIKFCFDGDTNMTGSIALFTMAGLVVFSMFPTLRRWFFELWYHPHIIGAVIAGVFAVIHGASEIVIVLIWWGVDIATRYVLMAGILYPKKASIRKVSDDIVEISFLKPENFEYEAGQYAMIAIPKINFTQFHPFTISSSPHQDTLTMHVKGLGCWTRKLIEIAEKEKEVACLIEGPYGKLMIDLENKDKYKMVLMISGGIGVTPMYSIANELLYEYETEQRDLKRLNFVWVNKTSDMMDAMMYGDSRRPDESNIFYPKNSSDIVDLNIYLTKKSNDVEMENMDMMLKEGRPHILDIFEKMKTAAMNEGERHVAVCVCGPKRLVDSCRELSRKCSDCVFQEGVTFDFHEETFEF